MNSKDNVTKKEKNKKKRNPFRFFFFDFMKVTGALSVLVWLRPKYLYESKSAKKHVRGGALVTANHTSIIDPIALYCTFWYRRVHILAMRELFERKLSAWFFRSALCIPVNRKEFDMDFFRSAVELLKDGAILGIFPEGRINHDVSTVEPFKSGAVLIALKSHVPIVPVYISSPKKWYNRTVIVVGEPINPEEFCGSTASLRAMDDVSQKLREKEIELMEIYEKWKTKKSSK